MIIEPKKSYYVRARINIMSRHQRTQRAPRQSQQENIPTVIPCNIQTEHNINIRETEDFYKAKKTVKEHCTRLNEMIKWIQVEYPTYCSEVVKELTEKEQADKSRYHTSTHDFIYQSLNVDVTKAFLSHKKIKPNKFTADGKPIHYSFSHIRKYHDAILFGSLRAKVALPEIYELEMVGYLDSAKKEKTGARKKGQLEEKEADAISFELYRLLCKFAIQSGNIFLWAFTCTQWSCMARSISIDDLTFAQISLGTDALVVEYCDSKSDPRGERTSPKNCYANPFDFRVCLFTALGCYFCVNDETWHSERDTIFRNKKKKTGSAAHRYCEQIKHLYKQNSALIEEYVRAGHFNPHGTRKGAAVCASSGTTLPASLAAIANRGEWTISMVFEVYLGFAEPGDQYLGRLLAGLLPNTAEFAVIPPHFLCGMENEFVAQAMKLCFQGILDKPGNIKEGISLRSSMKAVLLRCLASMVHHSESLLKGIDEDPGHCFSSIPILCNSSLLSELKKLLTSESSERIRMPTGIPPHVEVMTKLDTLTKLINQDREDRLKHNEEVKCTIVNKIEEISVANGQITRQGVEEMFNEFGSKFENTVAKKLI